MVSRYACMVLIISSYVLIMPPCCREELPCPAASCYNFQISWIAVACVCVCVHVRGQKVDGYSHVFPVILRCACAYVHVCGLLVCLQVQPMFPWPRLEQQTDMQRPAPCCTGIFLDCCVTVRQAVGVTSFSKPNDSFPGL